jgi:predicted signal transduction protein with EAL and GGDEF domain
VRPGDLVARLGGDEFSIVAEHVHHIGDAEAIAIRMLEELERPFVIHDHSITVGVSIGIAAPLSPATDSEQIMRCADLALYEAKGAGRNGFKVFELEMQDRMDARSIVEMGLRQATRKGELELYYQPIYELATLRLARFEALIRWRHPTKGILSPAEFLPVAEEIGLINEIGAWVVHEACRQAMSWPADISVAVNLSPIQVNHTQVVDMVKRALKESRLPPSRLEIEITETALLSDSHQTKQKLEQLKELGCYLSMDDFGTGYSSLSYLATFPLDGIKIDKAFITRFATRNENAEIMRAMLELAKALNRSTTVEGIETLAQLNAAKSLGATYGQGYYFSRPVPAAEALDLITTPERLCRPPADPPVLTESCAASHRGLLKKCAQYRSA